MTILCQIQVYMELMILVFLLDSFVLPPLSPSSSSSLLLLVGPKNPGFFFSFYCLYHPVVAVYSFRTHRHKSRKLSTILSQCGIAAVGLLFFAAVSRSQWRSRKQSLVNGPATQSSNNAPGCYGKSILYSSPSFVTAHLGPSPSGAAAAARSVFAQTICWTGRTRRSVRDAKRSLDQWLTASSLQQWHVPTPRTTAAAALQRSCLSTAAGADKRSAFVIDSVSIFPVSTVARFGDSCPSRSCPVGSS